MTANTTPKSTDRSASPIVFLIDPILQVIEKKRYRFLGFDISEIDFVWDILAMKDRMFFIINDYTPTGLTALVSEIGSDLITRRFTLLLPLDLGESV